MTVVSEEQAAKQFSALRDLVLQGEEVIITREGQPIARLGPVEQAEATEKPKPRFGSGKGTLVYMSTDFNAPLQNHKEIGERISALGKYALAGGGSEEFAQEKQAEIEREDSACE